MTATRDDGPTCDYCGLPLSGGWRRARDVRSTSAPRTEPEFCCFGCRLASSITSEKGETGQSHWTLTRLGLAIFFTMNVMVFTMALWSRDVYADHPSVGTPTATALYELLRYGCLLFATPVVLLLGGPILEQAWQSLRRGQITTDWLLSVGIVASLVYSILSVLTGGAHIYFEVSCMVLVAVTLGRWLEATGKLKTTEAIRALQRLLPERAHVQRGDQVSDVPLSEVRVGELIRILPGERVPLDGQIQRNRASIDQQLLTGESDPVTREPGDAIFAGSLNLDGDLTMSVTAPASAGTLQRMVDLVTTALAEKSAEQRLADRMSHAFVPLMATIALGTFAAYLPSDGFHQALMTSLAVVLIACPCALAIATPMAVWAALGTACQEQVVFRRGDALSRLARVKVVCFDKTGTITSGNVEVDQVHVAEERERDEVWRRAVALAGASNHVLAHAVLRQLEADTCELPQQVAVVSGRGVTGVLAGDPTPTYLGSWAYMQQVALNVPASLQAVLAQCQAGSQSFSCVGWAGSVRAVLVFRERVRPSALAALTELREMGLMVTLLTGDHDRRARQLAAELRVEVRAELLPEDKLKMIEQLRAEHGPVAMVGDGINDAPALAAADVGIAMGCGAEVSRDAAEVCLLGNDLGKIPWAIRWARETRRTIRQNLFWAFAYNLVGVSLAVAKMLNPIVAAIAMVGSSLFVVSNSLRLSRITVGDRAKESGSATTGDADVSRDDRVERGHAALALTTTPTSPLATP